MTDRRVIATLAIGEEVPEGAITYTLPVAGVVIDVITDENFSTNGTIHFDTTVVTPAVLDENGEVVTPRVIATTLAESHVHHFAGWENNI